MKKQTRLYEQGLEEYPRSSAILGNLVMLLWFTLGTIACWFLSPLLAWIYLGFALVMVYVVLRKLVCVNCYYYGRWCSIGWGKLCALMFESGDIHDFDRSIGQRLAPATYGVLSLVPLILLIVSLVLAFSPSKLVVLLLFLLVCGYSATAGRKRACADCKMRLTCKGSAA